jgi:hypothetical protein
MRRFVVSAVLALAAFATPASADPPPFPQTYRTVAPGGRFAFVMLSPMPSLDESGAGKEVRQAYPQSGMYRNDGSTDPLWTVDWYAQAVELAADGVHLVRPGPWAWLRRDEAKRIPDLDQEAVNFFAAGRLIRTYQIGELVDQPDRLPISVSHFQWVASKQLSGEFEYTVTTRDGNHFVFDIRTGAILSESRSVPPGRWWVVVAVPVVFVGAWLLWRRRCRRGAADTGSASNRNPDDGY